MSLTRRINSLFSLERINKCQEYKQFSSACFTPSRLYLLSVIVNLRLRVYSYPDLSIFYSTCLSAHRTNSMIRQYWSYPSVNANPLCDHILDFDPQCCIPDSINNDEWLFFYSVQRINWWMQFFSIARFVRLIRTIQIIRIQMWLNPPNESNSSDKSTGWNPNAPRIQTRKDGRNPKVSVSTKRSGCQCQFLNLGFNFD